MKEVHMIADSSETGSLGACHLKRFWSSVAAKRSGQLEVRPDERHLDRLVLDALGLGLQQTTKRLFMEPTTFAGFEDWIIATVGLPERDRLDRLNATLLTHEYTESVQQWLADIDQSDPVLTPEDLLFWEENGYVILRNAVSSDACAEAERTVWGHVGSVPVRANACDLIIWHQFLPHGSRPNLEQNPRIVQYINMYCPHLLSS
jgi:hypothetical protein